MPSEGMIEACQSGQHHRHSRGSVTQAVLQSGNAAGFVSAPLPRERTVCVSRGIEIYPLGCL